MSMFPFNFDYVAVPASTTKRLAPTGNPGDILMNLVITPATIGGGPVSIQDGANAAIVIMNTGTLQSLAPISVNLGVSATQPGGWSVITGANVSAIASGRFT